MSQRKQFHITKSADGWRVTQSGQALSKHRTQKDALNAAARVARREGSDIVIHGRDGKIVSKDTYVPYEKHFFKDSGSKRAIVSRDVIAPAGKASTSRAKIAAVARKAIRDSDTGRWVSRKSS